MAQSALAVRQDFDEVAQLAYLRDLSHDVADSRLFNGMTCEQATCLMLAGRDLGVSYIQAVRMFDLIKGKPSLKADALIAIVKAHHTCEKLWKVEESATHAKWLGKRKGEPEQVSVFTMEDAKTAGLLDVKDGNWQKYPKRMLNARAKAFLVKDVWPDLVFGLMSTEELADIERVDVEAVDIMRERRANDVRHVPEPRPTPAPKSGPRDVVDPMLQDAKGLVDEMRAAMSLGELSAVVAKVQGFGFPDEIRSILIAEHKTQKARVTPPEDAGDSWEPARG